MQQVGRITKNVIATLNLDIVPNMPIYIGTGNIEHIKAKHAADYAKYFVHIKSIIEKPDYVGKNRTDLSIEYVKEFAITNSEYVKVAVRVSHSGNYYVRSLYTLNASRVHNFIAKGMLKKV